MSTNVQSVVFDKPPKGHWTYKEATKWLRDYKFKNTNNVDEKKDTYRFRQENPGKFDKFYTKKISNGISLVIGEK